MNIRAYDFRTYDTTPAKPQARETMYCYLWLGYFEGYNNFYERED